MKWNRNAEVKLDSYITANKELLIAQGADPKEVADDLRVHIMEDVIAQGRYHVSPSDVTKVIGSDEFTTTFPNAPKPIKPTKDSYKSVYFFGIIVPIIAYLLELTTGACSAMFFDPMPTFLHVFGVGFVIVINIKMSNAIKNQDDDKSYVQLLKMNALVCGFCIYFSFKFIHIMPMAIMGSIVGIGLLPLSPLLALYAASFFRRHYSKSARQHFYKICFLGFMICFVTDIPRIITLSTLKSISNSRQTISKTQINILKYLGSNSSLEQAILGINRQKFGDIYSLTMLNQTPSIPECQKLYFLVTGLDLKENDNDSYYDQFDFNQGEDKVGHYLKDLHLMSSRIDSSVDADGGVAYTEWTMEFINHAKFRQAEARARIMLPEGSVVSRLTLWINGEEREAAFAKKGQVVSAYKKIVRRQMDPVLVTTSGDDQIRMQCFPVPPRGGVMKLRIGITSPVQLTSNSDGYLSLPIFSDRNFLIADDFEHNMWLESKTSMRYNDKNSVKNKQNVFSLMEDIEQKSRTKSRLVSFKRNPTITSAFYKNYLQSISSTIIEKPVTDIVIDGSVGMDKYIDNVVDILKSSKRQAIRVYLAGAEESSFSIDNLSPIEDHDFVGGFDNIPTLKKAWTNAYRNNGAVLWIHADQPVAITSPSTLKQILDRDSSKTIFYDYSVTNGVNIVNESINEVKCYNQVSGDLSTLIPQLCGEQKQINWTRTTSTTTVENKTTKQTSKHLQRLSVNDQIKDLIAENNIDKATLLASQNHLVTPVTGAVVLENQGQYQENNLTPVDSSDVPTIPEPETWAMIIIALFFLLFFNRKKKMVQC